MPWHFAVPRAALSKAEPDEDAPDVRALVDAAHPELLAALLAALQGLGTQVDASALRAALGAGDAPQVMVLLAESQSVPLFVESIQLLLPLMVEAAALVLGVRIAAVGVPLAPPLASLVTAHQTLIRQTTQEALPLIVEAVESWGLSIAHAAVLMQAMIGLTPAQVRTLAPYRAQRLEQPTGAMHLVPLLLQRIEALQRQRATRIAATVSMQAVNTAQRLAVVHAMVTGQRDGTRLRRYWMLGDRPCRVCQPIPGLNADGRGMGEPFLLASGGTAQEPPLHVQCFCTIQYR